MKGKVFTGIVYLPRHPNADMHGLLRCVVRTDGGMVHLASILRLYDIPFSPMLFNWGIWCESKSVVEQTVSEKHYGRALVCPTWQQYLEVANYQPIPDRLKAGACDTGRSGGPPSNTVLPVGRHLFTASEDGTGRRRCKVCHQEKDENPKHVSFSYLSSADGRPVVPPLALSPSGDVQIETETK